MKIVSVMSDYGMSPYAWIKDENDQKNYVGINYACYQCRPSTVSEELHDSFIKWCSEFEKFADDDSFNWEKFHDLGLSLSKKLKQELGSNFKVLYVKPCEDPSWRVDSVLEITGEEV